MPTVQTIPAMPTRTSPVKRGVYVLENILGTPPPPPPPAVPSVSYQPKHEPSAPRRYRLAQHRSDPNCSVRPPRMDGNGFSPENFCTLSAWHVLAGKCPSDS